MATGEQSTKARSGADLQSNPEDIQLEVGPVTVPLSAQLYGDARPTIKNIANILEGATAIPSGLVNLARKSYISIGKLFASKTESIPDERLCSPDIRLVAHVADSSKALGDEPTLQELFAQLLASGSDSLTKSTVRPTFADMIAQLEPFDAEVLRLLAQFRGGVSLGRLRREIWDDDVAVYSVQEPGPPQSASRTRMVAVALDNLARVGLIKDTPTEDDEKGLRKAISERLGDAAVGPSSHSNDELATLILDIVGGRDRVRKCVLTSLGRQFVESALGRSNVALPPVKPNFMRRRRPLR